MRASQTECDECLTCVRVPRTGQDDRKEQPISLHLLCHVTGRLPGYQNGREHMEPRTRGSTSYSVAGKAMSLQL